MNIVLKVDTDQLRSSRAPKEWPKVTSPVSAAFIGQVGRFRLSRQLAMMTLRAAFKARISSFVKGIENGLLHL